MQRRIRTFAWLAVAAVVALTIAYAGVTAQSQDADGARSPRNAEEFDRMFKEVSNWGRWGKDDQLGAVNLITDAKRKEAVSLVKAGISVALVAALGVNLLDNQDLEALADTAAKLNRWEFMLTVAPIPVTGGTGSPVNALATF